MVIQDELILKRYLWRLFHIESQIETNSREIKEKNKALSGLRKEQAAHDKALEDARAKQAKARSDVSALEKKLKKAEKALDNRVSGILSLRLSHSMLSFFQKPDLVAAESKIQHAQRKLRNHEATRESAAKDAKKQEDRLAGLRKDLIVEQKAADVARGKKGAIIFAIY